LAALVSLLAAGIIAAAIVFHALSTLKGYRIMSASLDNLTAGVSALETAANGLTTATTAATAEISTLQAGPDNAALDALTGRLATVTAQVSAAGTALTNAVTPPPTPAA
jgi:uncharacterized protein YoxC